MLIVRFNYLRNDQGLWSEEPEIVSEVDAIESEFNQVKEGLDITPAPPDMHKS